MQLLLFMVMNFDGALAFDRFERFILDSKQIR